MSKFHLYSAIMLSVIDNHKLISMGFHIHIGLLSLTQTYGYRLISLR